MDTSFNTHEKGQPTHVFVQVALFISLYVFLHLYSALELYFYFVLADDPYLFHQATEYELVELL